MNTGRPAIQILEESVSLLRSSPRALLLYLIGAVPFIVALLIFLNDMMLSPFAFEHLAAWSLALAALYIWKNTWQAIFAAQLYRALSPHDDRPIRITRALLVQGALQPLGLAIPLPFPWLTAFFRNVALFSARGDPDALRNARKQAVLWTGQNWAILAIASLAFIVLTLNSLLMIVFLPQLARSFLGIEGDFARAGADVLTRSSFGVALALAWLVIDPVLDAAFVLRCFYGESIVTGEDLRAALRKAIATVALLLILISTPLSLRAQSADPPLNASIKPAELDRSINAVIHSREFTWRDPHTAAAVPDSKVGGWIRSALGMIHDAWEAIKRAIFDWLNGDRASQQDSAAPQVSRRMVRTTLALLVVLIAAGAVAFFMRRRARAVKAQAVDTAVAAAVDLADESLTADQLPESSWLKLAEELIAQGDCRHALRALHLAGLNFLNERGMVSVRRWKTGLEYRRELERRARATPEIAPVFSSNVDLFERGWYGRRPVDREMVEAFATRMNEIRNHAR